MRNVHDIPTGSPTGMAHPMAQLLAASVAGSAHGKPAPSPDARVTTPDRLRWVHDASTGPARLARPSQEWEGSSRMVSTTQAASRVRLLRPSLA